MFKNKKVIAAVLMTALVGTGAFMFTRTASAGADEMPLNTAVVETMDITSNVYASGNVSITESRNLKPETKGLVTNLDVKVGDKVIEGQVLAEIDSVELKQSLERKQIGLELEQESLNQTLLQGTTTQKSELKKAVMSYDTAKEKYEKDKVLFESGAISQKSYDESENNYEQEKLNLESAQNAINNSSFNSEVRKHKLNIQLIESEIEEITAKIEKQRIISPINGTVTSINYKKGEMYDEDNALIKVQDFDSKEIKTLISEGEINKLSVGLSVDITANSMKGQTLQGKVASISPGTTKKEGKAQAYTEVIVKLTEPTDLLRDGFLVNLNIEAQKAEGVNAVSFEAVSRNLDGKATVTKLSADGTTIVVPVEVGIEGDVYVELISDKIHAGDELLMETAEDMTDSFAEGLL